MARRGVGLGKGWGARCALAGLLSWSGALAAEAPSPNGPELSRSSSTPQSEQSPKVLNRTLFAPPDGMEAGEQIFLTGDMRKPRVGACEMVPADAGYVEEMLVNIDSIGSPDGKTYQRRVAFVVGNSAYPGESYLPNPKNDATSMAKLMHLLGFDVYYAADVKEEALETCLEKFRADLERKTADVALFFYAGHGVPLMSEGEKRNYMMSVDWRVDAAGVGHGFRQIDAVLDEMRKNARQSVFLYDACRSAPKGVTANITEADGGPVSRQGDLEGAANVEVTKTDASSAPQLFIAYATSPGKTADDSWGPEGSRHSPFTQALLESLPEPGAIFEEALAKAYYRVNELTGGRQTPWTSSSLQRPLGLNGSVRRQDIQITSGQRASRSASFSAQGLRGLAIAEALKGLPNKWLRDEQAKRFGAARSALFRSYEDKSVNFSASFDAGITVAEYSVDGKTIITGSGDGEIKVWNAETGDLISELPNANNEKLGPVLGAQFSPDNKHAIAWRVNYKAESPRIEAESTSAIIFDIRTGVTLTSATKEGLSSPVAKYSPDGKLLLLETRANNFLILLTLDYRTKISEASEPLHPNGIVFNDDGSRFFLGLTDGTIEIRDLKSFSILKRIENSNCHVRFGRRAARNGLIFMVCNGPSICILDTTSGAAPQCIEVGGQKVGIVETDRNDRRLLVVTDENAAKIFDLSTGNKIATFSGLNNFVDQASISSDGAKLVIRSFGALSLFDINGKLKIWESDPATLDALDAEFSPDGNLVLVGARDGRSTILDATQGGLHQTLRGHLSGIRSVAFSSDTKRLITGSSDETARIWSVADGAEIKSLGRHGEEIINAQFHDGDRILHTETATSYRVWDGETYKLLKTAYGERKWVSCCEAFSPNLKKVVVGFADGKVVIFDSETRAPILEIPGHAADINDAIFSPDGNYVVTGSNDGTAKSWDAKSGRLVTTFLDDQTRITNVAINKDNTLVITGDSSGRIFVWDMHSGHVLKKISAHRGPIMSARFAFDSKYVATGGIDAIAKVWTIGLFGEELIEAGKSLLSKRLQEEVERDRIRYWEFNSALVE